MAEDEAKEGDSRREEEKGGQEMHKCLQCNYHKFKNQTVRLKKVMQWMRKCRCQLLEKSLQWMRKCRCQMWPCQLPPATPVSTTEATSTSVVPAMDAEQQLSAEPLLATENPVAEDLLAAGPSNVPSTTEGIEPDPSTSVSPPHAAAPVVPEEPAAPVVPEEPAAPVVARPVVPEEPAGPVVPASALPSGAPRFVSAKERQTPAIMQRLAPPFCTFALDFKAHRFSFKYRKAPSPNVWTEHFKYPMSMSKTFADMHWKDALKEVHAGAWRRWNLAKDQSGWELLPADAQTPGCFADDLFAEMAGVIDNLPPVVNYPRAASA